MNHRFATRPGLLACLLLAAFSCDLAAGPFEASVAQGLTIDNNITLLSQDINFGPLATSQKDVFAHLELALGYHRGQFHTGYRVQRSHFFKNPQLHYLWNSAHLLWDVPGWLDSSYRLRIEYDWFNADQPLAAGGAGRVPFVTAELPTRRVQNLAVDQALSRRDRIQAQVAHQQHRFEHRSLLDSDTVGGLARYRHRFDGGFEAFVERGADRKDYPGLIGIGGVPPSLRTDQDRWVAGLVWESDRDFSILGKLATAGQEANVPEFELDQRDLTVILAGTPSPGLALAFSVLVSERDFPRRLDGGTGAVQKDDEVLIHVTASKAFTRKVVGTVGFTYDRNDSTARVFDYENTIARIEFRTHL